VDVSRYESVLFPVPNGLQGQGPEVDNLNNRLSTMYESISLMANEVDLRNLLQAGRNLRGFDTHTSAILESVQSLFSQVEKNIPAVIGLQMLLVFLNTLGVNKCIGESKRHHGELKLPVTGDKSCLWDVAFSNLELKIS